jgi:thiamine biosynthesis lipoprotein ApbE
MKKIHLQAVAAIIILVLAAGVFLFRGRAEEPVVIDETRFMMGTMVRIRTPVEKGKSQKRIRQAVGAAFAEIERVEKAFSVYIRQRNIEDQQDPSGRETRNKH